MQRIRSLFRIIKRWVLRPIARLTGDVLSLATALVAGAGVFLIVAGLFYYVQPASAGPNDSPTPAAASVSVAPISLQPRASLMPSAGTSVPPAIATRIRIEALGIDLPIVASPANEEFPLCNAAEYAVVGKTLAYPGLPQATYLYAHARTGGMFLPLLSNAKVDNGAAMIGDWVEIFTADNQDHVYQITKVIRHVLNTPAAYDGALAATSDQLWLQTSEGPQGDPLKMQVVAEPIPGGKFAVINPADAHPTGKGNVCPDAPKCKAANGGGCKR
jgi:hypothetical protein